MFNQKLSKKVKTKGQAIVEFAIALPVFLALLIGILEVGRLAFIYSTVNSASRNASRYASVVGYEQSGTYLKYVYCDGIKNVAIKSGYMANLKPSNITISYDEGPGTTSLGNCTATGGNDTTMKNILDTNNKSIVERVVVKVQVSYQPMLKLIPIGSRTLTATSARSILGIIDLEN
ncbi:MAG TPA: TadE/TadG family type IV pilus assembly protein [Anaerolineales bacterium]|nr:TadE/TadG family type IV pilus assembly protein [Anaerolineales bacterium]